MAPGGMALGVDGAGFAMGVGRGLGGDGTGVIETVLADLFDEWYDELDEAILDCDAGDVC